jgi:hypothetical protein
MGRPADARRPEERGKKRRRNRRPLPPPSQQRQSSLLKGYDIGGRRIFLAPFSHAAVCHTTSSASAGAHGGEDRVKGRRGELEITGKRCSSSNLRDDAGSVRRRFQIWAMLSLGESPPEANAEKILTFEREDGRELGCTPTKPITPPSRRRSA